MKRVTFLYTEFLKENIPAVTNYWREDKAKEIAPFFEYLNTYSSCFEKDGYLFDFVDILTYDPTMNNQIYVFDLMRSIFKKCVYDLPLSTIEQLRNHNIPMLFYFPSEGFEFTEYLWIDHIQKQLTEVGLEKNQKFLIFGTGYFTQIFYDKHILKFSDQKTQNDYIELCNFDKDFFELSHRSKMTKCFGVNWFEQFHYNKLKDSAYYNSKKYQKKLLEILDTEHKTKNFLCLNRNLRYQRLALVSELCRNNLHLGNHLTLIGSPLMPSPGPSECWKVTERILKEKKQRRYFEKFIENFCPIKASSVKDDGSHGDLFLPPLQYYRETFYSVVTETEVSDNTLFISEKTLKPFSFYHPFLLFGNPYSLRYLRSLGYETFPEMFDESYDEEESIDKRFNMIIYQILEFKKLPRIKKIKRFNSIIDKLRHNKKLCDERMKQSNHKITVESLEEILKIIN